MYATTITEESISYIFLLRSEPPPSSFSSLQSDPPSLLHDHICERTNFPLHITHELQHHRDEVWHLEFSHDGSMLASASKDNSVMVYDTTSWMLISRLEQPNTQQESGVCYISWSPDSTYLLACSQTKELTIYEVRVRSWSCI